MEYRKDAFQLDCSGSGSGFVGAKSAGSTSAGFIIQAQKGTACHTPAEILSQAQKGTACHTCRDIGSFTKRRVVVRRSKGTKNGRRENEPLALKYDDASPK
jgi:hypothetical protein